jgi:hypothetical protein
MRIDKRQEILDMRHENKIHIIYFPLIKGVRWILYFILLLSISGCKVYSFTGASLPADVKTVTVDQIRNSATNGPALLNQTITDALKNKLITEASLRQVTYDGDLVFKGAVTGYSYAAQAPTAQLQSGVNRLTITIQITFENKKYPKDSWKQAETFSRYADAPGSANLSDVQDALIADIVKQLMDDIFNKAFVKW